MSPLEKYYESKLEPLKGTLLALRRIILKFSPEIEEAWKYRMPFFTINGKMFCYLWIHKKYKQPYISFVDGKKIEHPDLLLEKRARMKILLIDPEKDIPEKLIIEILTKAKALR